jgi:hypothetical protein
MSGLRRPSSNVRVFLMALSLSLAMIYSLKTMELFRERAGRGLVLVERVVVGDIAVVHQAPL